MIENPTNNTDVNPTDNTTTTSGKYEIGKKYKIKLNKPVTVDFVWTNQKKNEGEKVLVELKDKKGKIYGHEYQTPDVWNGKEEKQELTEFTGILKSIDNNNFTFNSLSYLYIRSNHILKTESVTIPLDYIESNEEITTGGKKYKKSRKLNKYRKNKSKKQNYNKRKTRKY